jgi:protein-S-isoprenylcysteine O-methyltransferase Ste14
MKCCAPPSNYWRAELASWGTIARRIRVPLGFAFAAFYLWLAKPNWKSLLIGGLVCLPGLWLRAMASGHVRKNSVLTTSGPYAHTRNPLYLGSLLIAAGFGIAGRNWWIGLIILAIFGVVYLPVIRAEEEFLRTRFSDYQDYADRVPRLFPRWSSPGTAEDTFSAQLYWQHREYNSILGASVIMAALVVKLLWFSS